MSADISITYLALSAQRDALEVAARDLGSAMDSAHGAETGVQAPVGRTCLRETLEGAIGTTRAQLRLAEEDVSKVTARVMAIETEIAELDLRLGVNWEDLPL